MRIVCITSLLCLTFLLCGCGADKPAGKDQAITAPPPKSSTGNQAQPAPGVSKTVAPPADAQWTIYCFEVSGPGHVEQINMMKSQLEKVSGMNAWHALHDEVKSSLYYGYYKTRNGSDLVADRKKLAQLRDDRGDTIFANSVPVPLDAPDPASPPEWNLLNAKGYWSVQVAAFQGDQRRKEAAVEAVRDFRAQNIDAYYFHGENVSSVCVGAFPEEALKKQEDDKGETLDPNQPMMVINGDIPEAMRRHIQSASGLKDRDGNPVRVFVQKVEVVDPNMLAIFRQFPVHRYNYNEEFVGFNDPRTGKIVQYPKPCVIVPIPHKDPAADRPRQNPQTDLIAPGLQTNPGGQLRRVGQ